MQQNEYRLRKASLEIQYDLNSSITIVYFYSQGNLIHQFDSEVCCVRN